MRDISTIILGTHIDSTIDTIYSTIELLPDNINAVQFFVDPSIDYHRYKDIKHIIAKKNIHAFIHSSYKINIAKDWDESSWWVKYIIYEIKIAHLLGADGVIIHTGYKMSLDSAVALNNIYTLLMYIHNITKKESDIKLLIETPSGKGSEMLSNYDIFINFMTKFNNIDRIGICIDTCHIFSAGYDIRKPEILKGMILKIKQDLGNKLGLIHLNDTKDDIGSKKDRHDSLGYGFIGRKGLKKIINIIKNEDVPIILETPRLYHDDEIKWIRTIILTV
jgi:apurinic endonuclease APN1